MKFAPSKRLFRGLLVVTLGTAACTSLSGCLLAAAGAGAAGGYIIGKESEKDKRTEIHVHEERAAEPAPRTADVD